MALHLLRRRSKYYLHIGATLSSLVYFNTCENVTCDGSKKDIELEASSVFELMIRHVKNRASGDEDQRIRLGQEVGLGFTLGVTSGFALKKAARTILFTVRQVCSLASLFPVRRNKQHLNLRAEYSLDVYN